MSIENVEIVRGISEAWARREFPGPRRHGPESRVGVEGQLSALWTLRGGKVVRFEWFHGADEAFEAIGS